MENKLIRNKDCHIWQAAEVVLKEALSEVGLPSEYEIVVVENDEEAQKYKFFGSPQITIDGEDVDPAAAKATQFQITGCRIYMWQGKMYEYPPREMIIEKLKVKSAKWKN